MRRALMLPQVFGARAASPRGCVWHLCVAKGQRLSTALVLLSLVAWRLLRTPAPAIRRGYLECDAADSDDSGGAVALVFPMGAKSIALLAHRFLSGVTKKTSDTFEVGLHDHGTR